MKYKINIIVLCFMYHAAIYNLDQFTNQMFMFTKTLFNSIGVQQTSWYDFGYDPQKKGTSVQMYPLYTESFATASNRQYFLFDFKEELLMQGGVNPTGYTLTAAGYVPVNPMENQISTQSYTRDILGQWFNFNEDENALFTINPRQKQASFIFEINQELKKILNCSFADFWYVTIKAPITYVCNNFGLEGSQKTVEALTNNNFNYANFSNFNQKSTAVTNVQVILGTKYLRDQDSIIILGTGLVIPLVESLNNRYLFEPLNGFNGHFGLTGIALFQFPLVQKNDAANSRLCFFFEFENNFLARNFQLRTYDLRGKPYSRYLKLLDRNLNTTVPAMNALTIRSRVEPFNIFDMATGFRLKYRHCTGELGYELWAHGSEVVTPEPNIPWPDSRYGIAFINDQGELAKINDAGNIVPIDTTTESGLTASNSTINFVAAPDGVTSCCPTLTFTPQNRYIDLEDLDDFASSARAALVHRAYVSFSFGDKGKNRDMFANFGLYIEGSQNDAALSMWGAWAKVGLTF